MLKGNTLANTLLINVPFVLVGLNTWTYTIPTGAAGIYNIHVESTEIPPSGVVFKVKKAGVDQFTAPVLGQTQSALQFKYSALFAAADVITMVMTSATGSDSDLNNVKTTCTIGQGA